VNKCFVCGKPARDDLFEKLKLDVIDAGGSRRIEKRVHFRSERCRKVLVFLSHMLFVLPEYENSNRKI